VSVNISFFSSGRGIRFSKIAGIWAHLPRFILNPAYAPSANPFGRGYPNRIGRIQSYHTVGGANGTTMVVMFVGSCVGGWRYFPYYSYCRDPTGREFFVPAGFLIAVKLLNSCGWAYDSTLTVTTTDVSSDLGEFTEILDDVSVETIPIRYCWGCRTFQTASHIYVIHILGVWTP